MNSACDWGISDPLAVPKARIEPGAGALGRDDPAADVGQPADVPGAVGEFSVAE